MGIIVNNIKPIRIMFNGVEATLYHNGIKIWPEVTDPYNPLNLPANTVRVRTNDGAIPNKGNASYETATLVSGTSDVYDVYRSGTDFTHLFNNSKNVVEVLGANTTGVTNMDGMFDLCSSLTSVSLFDTSSVQSMQNMFKKCTALTAVPLFNTSSVIAMTAMFSWCSSLTSMPLFNTSSVEVMLNMFYDCSSLTSVPLFNTSSVFNMNSMFHGCSSLTSVPLFNTSSVVSMNDMFVNCTKVQSGALALYQQASTQANPPPKHTHTFQNCGSDTTTGAAELAQIPEDWK